MKRLLFCLLVCAAFTVNAQKSLHIQVGPVYSTFKGNDVSFANNIGYFAGLTFQDKFSRVLGLESNVSFLNQRTLASDNRLSIRSVNALFGVNLYPGNSGFHFTVGPEVGHTIDYKMEGEDIPVDNNLRFGVVGGVGYVADERFSIRARYIHAIDDQGSGFDYNVQLGFAYRIFQR